MEEAAEVAECPVADRAERELRPWTRDGGPSREGGGGGCDATALSRGEARRLGTAAVAVEAAVATASKLRDARHVRPRGIAVGVATGAAPAPHWSLGGVSARGDSRMRAGVSCGESAGAQCEPGDAEGEHDTTWQSCTPRYVLNCAEHASVLCSRFPCMCRQCGGRGRAVWISGSPRVQMRRSCSVSTSSMLRVLCCAVRPTVLEASEL